MDTISRPRTFARLAWYTTILRENCHSIYVLMFIILIKSSLVHSEGMKSMLRQKFLVNRTTFCFFTDFLELIKGT
ncbi:MAG: hypothetical protein ACTSWE_14110, partial [Promethearchaeota archaeon]